MSFATTDDDAEIYFKDSGSGRPLALSRGRPLNAGDWDTQKTSFASRGFRRSAHARGERESRDGARRGEARSHVSQLRFGRPLSRPTNSAIRRRRTFSRKRRAASTNGSASSRLIGRLIGDQARPSTSDFFWAAVLIGRLERQVAFRVNAIRIC